jgi:hypothetical protein
MRLNADNRTIQSLLIAFCLFASCRFLFAQGFVSDWPELHKQDLSRWAAKSNLSVQFLSKLTETATREDANDVEEGYFQYLIENVDAKSFSQRNQILLSTWAAGTGHCLTLYVLKKEGSRIEKVWQSHDNLCTASILGAAKTQAMPDGRIIVRYREYSQDHDHGARQEPPILRVKVIYKWDGVTYVNAGRTERPESHVSGR